MRKQLGRVQRRVLGALTFEPLPVCEVAVLAEVSRRTADRCTTSLARAGYAVRSRGARNRVVVKVTEAGLNILVGV